MQAAPLPSNEAERLTALLRCKILDTPPEAAFDDIAQLASHICGVPIALVSLVDRDRQWFKARVGLAVPETSRDQSFCAHAILAPGAPLIVPDVYKDERFADNPLVLGDPNIRFYAGVPLVLENDVAVGTLCVIDRVPRELTPAQTSALMMLARQISTELRLRREVASLRTNPGEAAEPSSSRIPAALRVGVVAGRYHLEDLIGAGGMGVVVGAVDGVTGRKIAIKFILPEAVNEPMIARFVLEAQVLLRVGGAHVARVLDVGNLANGAPFIVMERLEGQDLDQVLNARGALPLDEAVFYFIQACEGVAAVHSAGIIHRDLKPSNLFLARRAGAEPVLKILDFGIARLLEIADQAVPTLTGANIIGSPHYMAPEQMMGDPLDVRTDIWGLGVVLYELLAYRRPFEGETPVEVCVRVMQEDPPPLLDYRPDLPPEVAEIVMCCLAKAPHERFATVQALSAALIVAVEG